MWYGKILLCSVRVATVRGEGGLAWTYCEDPAAAAVVCWYVGAPFLGITREVQHHSFPLHRDRHVVLASQSS